MPRHALSACLCHNPLPATLVCVCPCVHSITMCTRIIAQVAKTALQAAAHGDCIVAARAPFCVCLRHPSCSCHGGSLGLHWAASYLLVHFKGKAWDCIGQPATFLFISRGKPGTALGSRLPSCSCIGSQRLHLGSLSTLFKWPVGWHMACQVRVSCLQQLKTKKKVQ